MLSLRDQITMSTENVRRNAILPNPAPIISTPKQTIDISTTQTRSCVRVELEKDISRNLICPKTACNEAFAD